MKKVARIFCEAADEFFVCSNELDYLETRGECYDSLRAALRAALADGYTHATGSACTWDGISAIKDVTVTLTGDQFSKLFIAELDKVSSRASEHIDSDKLFREIFHPGIFLSEDDARDYARSMISEACRDVIKKALERAAFCAREANQFADESESYVNLFDDDQDAPGYVALRDKAKLAADAARKAAEEADEAATEADGSEDEDDILDSADEAAALMEDAQNSRDEAFEAYKDAEHLELD